MVKIDNILVFGATGRTGTKFVTQALNRNYRVTAFVRDPSRLQIKNDNLTVFQGNILNPVDVDNSVEGQDIVVVLLANKTSDAVRKSNTIISEAMVNIIAAMKNQGIKRLLFVSSFGLNHKIFWPEKIFIKTILKNIFADIPKQEELIKQSNLDWVIVRPARLVNEVKTGKYKMGQDIPIGLFSKISRDDVADFLVKNLENDSLIGKTITISY